MARRNRRGEQESETVVNVNAGGGEEGWLPLLMQQHPLVIIVVLMAVTLGSSILGSWSLYYWTQEDAKSARIDHYRVSNEFPELRSQIEENTQAINKLSNEVSRLTTDMSNVHMKVEDWRLAEAEAMRDLKQEVNDLKKLLLQVLLEKGIRD